MRGRREQGEVVCDSLTRNTTEPTIRGRGTSAVKQDRGQTHLQLGTDKAPADQQLKNE